MITGAFLSHKRALVEPSSSWLSAPVECMRNAGTTGSDEGARSYRRAIATRFVREAEMERNRPSLVPTNWVANPGRDHLPHAIQQQQHGGFRSMWIDLCDPTWCRFTAVPRKNRSRALRAILFKLFDACQYGKTHTALSRICFSYSAICLDY